MSEPGGPTLLIEHAAELLTCVASDGDPVGRVVDGAIAIAGERILAVGRSAEVRDQVTITSTCQVIDASRKVVMPGFVDAHTHVVFGSSRVDEYVARTRAVDVAPLRSAGVPVGILGTVRETRSLSVEQLVEQAAPRLRSALESGTTTIESKSGYGLSLDAELRQLQANRMLASLQPVDVVSTFLGAHAIPDGTARERYVALLTEEMLPAVAEQHLAEFCDVYCDVGYFTTAEAAAILERGIGFGLKPKLHLDEGSVTGAAALAASLRCTSVDHLNYTPADDLRSLADAGATAVLLPGLEFAVRHAHPAEVEPVRRAGLPIALATDCCPAAWITSMQLVIALACRAYHLAPGEAIWSATYGGARAVGRANEIGSLEPGKVADVLVLELDRHEHLAYRLGENSVGTVVKRGRVVHTRSAA